MSEIRGVTLDFFQTLVRHGTGKGRGASFMEYLASRGLSSQPWEHQVLYDVFEFYADAYRPGCSEDEERAVWIGLTERLFLRLGVSGPNRVATEDHADTVKELMGPSCLAVFDDVIPTLLWLRQQNLPVGIVSNWQRGLIHFCRELGVLDHVQFVLASAEVRVEKPDPRIFEMAIGKLQLAAGEILHVGDHPVEDVQAAMGVGMNAALLVRNGFGGVPGASSISSLSEIQGLVGG